MNSLQTTISGYGVLYTFKMSYILDIQYSSVVITTFILLWTLITHNLLQCISHVIYVILCFILQGKYNFMFVCQVTTRLLQDVSFTIK